MNRFIFMLLLFTTPFAHAQDNSDCLKCHETAGLQVVRGERTVSLFVDEEKYETSVHGSMDCIDCHESLDGLEDYPHAVKLDRVSCGACHDDEVRTYQKHGQLEVEKDPDLAAR